MGHGRYYEGSGQAVGGMQNRVAYARRLRFDQDFARPRRSARPPMLVDCRNGRINRHRGRSYLRAPATPPDMRVRIRRFGGLSRSEAANVGSPRESK